MRKIAIIGTAPLSKDLAPFEDKDWEIWVCSAGNMSVSWLNRITRWFELHALVELEGPENKAWANQYMPWLRTQTFPVWMLEKNDHVPQAHIFPCRELLKEFGREWFSSSIAWMMALAISEKVDTIGIFGVDMAADQEHYTAQRAGCRRFIEIAKENGIEVVIPWESCLGHPPPIYGLWENTPMGRRINVSEQLLSAKRGEIAATEERARLEKCFFDGALEQLRYIKRTFADGEHAFDFMSLPQIELAAQTSVDKALNAPGPAPQFTQFMPQPSPGLPTDIPAASVADHPRLKSPPPVGGRKALNGSGGHLPPTHAKKTHRRASQGRRGAVQ